MSEVDTPKAYAGTIKINGPLLYQIKMVKEAKPFLTTTKQALLFCMSYGADEILRRVDHA